MSATTRHSTKQAICTVEALKGYIISLAKALHPIFRIDAAEPGATAAQIDALRSTAALPLTPDYLAVVSEVTDVELLLNGKKHIRIWGASRCIEMNAAYQIQKHIPHSLAIGDDEGGRALILMNGGAGHGLYLVGFSELDASEATFLAPTLGDLLTKGIGSESV